MSLERIRQSYPELSGRDACRIAVGLAGFFLGAGLSDLFKDEFSLYDAYLWIQPYEGGKAYEFPFYQALRIVRKHDWILAEVEPVKPRKNPWYFLQSIAGIFLAIKHYGFRDGIKLLIRLGQK